MPDPKQIAGRYSINNVLGRGAMGTVYQAQDEHSKQLVAIKALNPAFITAAPELVTRFKREAEALRQLNHPNIVSIVDLIEEADRLYLVLEYIEGGNLQDRIRQQGALPPKRVLPLALNLADALTRAHQLGIIHRDLKPANVLLASDGTLRLTDFGMARLSHLSTLTEVGAIVGTIAYLSPEACMGRPLDERADIWSFGIMLYEMLMGERPFSGDNPAAVMQNILHSPLPDMSRIRPDLDERLVDLLYRILVKELAGRMPSIRLVGAELEMILQDNTQSTPVKIVKEDAFATPTPSTPILPHNLPAATTQFIGRRQELADLTRLLKNPVNRLVTILGAGGMGKTRLALELGRNLLNSPHTNSFNQGIYFIPLAPLTEPGAMTTAIAEATGYPIQDGEPVKDQLIRYLTHKNMLLLLDNFEHLMAGAPLVNEILQTAPDVQIVVTSRQKLNLGSESIFTIGGLGVPAEDTTGDGILDSALELFVYSARRAQLEFELNEDNKADVVHINRLVQGMPLGIILAAAWIDILSPEEIAAEIQTDLDFLISELGDFPERHRSMRAVFDYSWRLLDKDEQKIAARFSVFRGGFTREAAQQVAGASLRQLIGLVNKSLLQRDAASGRFEMHELLRQLAAEKLAEKDQQAPTQQQHAAYYRQLAQTIAPHLHRDNMTRWLGQLEMEYDNLQAAFEWLIANDVNGALQLVRALWLYWFIRGRFSEGRAWGMRALETAGPDTQSRPYAEATYVVASFAYFQHDLQAASHWSDISLKLSQQHNDLFGQGISRHHLGLIALSRGEFEKATAIFNAGLENTRALSDKWLERVLITDLSHVAGAQGNLDKQWQLMSKGTAFSRQLGNEFLLIYDLANMAHVMLEKGQLEQAGAYIEESLALATQIGEKRMIAHSLGIQANINQKQGHYETAAKLICQTLTIAYDIGDLPGILESLWILAVNNLLQGNDETAVLLWAAAETIYDQGDHHQMQPPPEMASFLASQEQNTTLMGVRERGHKMKLDDVVGFIFKEICK